MSLALSGFSASHSSSAASLIQTAYAIAEPAQQAGLRGDSTTVTLSQEGKNLAANDPTLTVASSGTDVEGAAPTQKISAAASERIGNFFRSAGIDVGVNAQFSVDSLGKLQISGVDGLTAARIRTQLDSHPDVATAVYALGTLAF
ncbi:MAG TPA: hypothetical protein VL968_01025 [Rhodocyclaceae bacterium]|nr:hypothetical protein [Rhodocyclaceae bacterium]